jgi:signal transduction histidine kinase
MTERQPEPVGTASPKGGVRWMGYIPQLFVLTILPLTALLLIITFGSMALHQRAMRDMAGEQDLRAVRMSARMLTEEIRHRENSLQSVALLAQTDASPQELLEGVEHIHRLFDGGLAVYAPDGTLLAATNTPRWHDLTPMQLDALFSGLTAGGDRQPVISTMVTGSSEDGLFVLTAATGGSGKVVTGSYSLSSLAGQTIGTTYAHGTSGNRHTVVTLVDGDGQVLYRTGSHPEHEDLATHPGIAEARRGESGVTYTRLGREQIVVAFSPVPPLGWGLVLEEPWEAMSNPLLLTTQTMPLVLVPALLLSLVGLWFGARQVIQPLQILEAQANDLSLGRYDRIREPVGGIAEIQHLQASLAEMARKVQAAQDNLRSYAEAITAGQEEERRRLAREIHDDTLQAVIALNQRVQLAQMSLGDHPIQESLAETQELTEQTIGNLRRLMRALRPAYLEELGLVAALEMLAKETSQANGTLVTFACEGEERRLLPEIELALYRMTQEGLSNIIRHAQASQAWLNIHFTPETVRVTIRDDGRGFMVPENPGEFVQAGHFGVLGLYERAEMCGAQLSLQSSPGKGTRIEIDLPDPN